MKRDAGSRQVLSTRTSTRGLWVAAALMTILLAPFRATAASRQGRNCFVRCAGCHLADGAGVPGSFPPLAARLGPLMSVPQGRDYLILVVQRGMMGDLLIDGLHYQGIMPAQGFELGDDGVAAALNYVLKEFNQQTLPAGWHAFSVAEVARIKTKYPSQGIGQLQQLRADVFRALER